MSHLELNNLKLFPNPTEGALTIDMDTLQGPAKLEWFNSAGQLVGSENWEATRHSLKTLDLSPLTTGIYWYRLSVGKRLFSGKVIKE